MLSEPRWVAALRDRGVGWILRRARTAARSACARPGGGSLRPRRSSRWTARDIPSRLGRVNGLRWSRTRRLDATRALAHRADTERPDTERDRAAILGSARARSRRPPDSRPLRLRGRVARPRDRLTLRRRDVGEAHRLRRGWLVAPPRSSPLSGSAQRAAPESSTGCVLRGNRERSWRTWFRCRRIVLFRGRCPGWHESCSSPAFARSIAVLSRRPPGRADADDRHSDAIFTRRGLRICKFGNAHAFVSAANTGAPLGGRGGPPTLILAAAGSNAAGAHLSRRPWTASDRRRS